MAKDTTVEVDVKASVGHGDRRRAIAKRITERMSLAAIKRTKGDGPTPERMKRGTIREQIVNVGDAGPSVVRRADPPIDIYRRRHLINEMQWRAGQRYAELHGTAQIGVIRSSSYDADRVDSGANTAGLTQARIDAGNLLAKADRALTKGLRDVVRIVVVEERPCQAFGESRGRRARQAQAIGMFALEMALDALAEHFGIRRRGVTGDQILDGN